MCRLKVLFVGLSESSTLVRDAVLYHPGSRLAIATSYWDLCSLSLHYHEEFQVALLEVSPSPRELRRRAEYIRRRWPGAAIVLIADGRIALDDPLYDERVPSNIGPDELLTVIDRFNRDEAVSDQKELRLRINAGGRRHALREDF